ncbi:putative bifunctional diguanylate cyclase/phosphodiesterase [Myxacorys almedinensis]|uniref:EAL domain-containing protein n=1 Tax=Myxacorys almedinensis A TaxID=2690445 RepID=A0A8J7Z3V7_9CYAN|nr:EAL domain-containing response regulator [Myxacorys almedinensis]NDJ17701.1 EAL domain-containing protein [Myxacorys almedinensis A]
MKTILVIEDDETIRSNLLEILDLEGFRVLGAEQGVAGVRKATAYLPDLILCDIRMPELDGYGVLEALRSHPLTAAIPVIFLTAKCEHQEVRRGMNLGADDYLIKPCSVTELLAAIASRLTKRTAIAQLYANEQRQAVEALQRGAALDPLTQLQTRSLLCQQIQRWTLEHDPAFYPTSLAEGQASSDLVSNTTGVAKLQRITILCLNIHRFRSINASFGHATGDILLKMVAHRLTKLVDSHGMLARLSGDEFGIVLTRNPQQAEVAELAQHIVKSISAPFKINGREIRIQISLGITLSEDLTQHPEHLITQAETARHWCKQQGQSYRFYSPEMDELEVERRLIEMDLTQAIERAEFQVHYQPQVNLRTGEVIGMESLLRWNHPGRGMISPATFIPIAEELGLIVPLGEWVLKTSCQHAKNWQQWSASPLRVSVNLSMRQFQQDDFVDRVAAILAETGLDPKLLVLELTETCLMQDVKTTITILSKLKALGIEISIDDFGTGYSSLNYLNSLPIDALKIDRSFVQHLATSEGANAISTAIIAMAKSLRLKVVAEGVETVKQLLALQEMGCQAMQGYLYSPAIPIAEVEILLQADRRLQLASA